MVCRRECSPKIAAGLTEGLRGGCLRLAAIAGPAELCGGTSILMEEV